MSEFEQVSWIAEMAETLRALPNEWADRRGEEFERLTSEERGAIGRKRGECLSIVGRLLIRAILDHGWLSGSRFVELEDQANRARQLERTKPYEQSAKKFLGRFVTWCREHPDQLPPGMPPLVPMNSHISGFKTEAVSKDDFAGTCEFIACYLESSAQHAAPTARQGAGGEVASHGPDFRNVVWYGKEHVFSSKQAACIRVLWEAWEQGTSWVADGTVLQKVRAGDRQRLRDQFKNHEAWGTMIVQGPQQDLHGLQEPSKKT